MPTEPADHPEMPPGLLALARERLRTRHLALRTEQAYLQWLQRYVAFHHGRHPRTLGAPEVEQFLTHLAVHREVSAATQSQALQALLASPLTCWKVGTTSAPCRSCSGTRTSTPP
jgi:hypothetical protein